MKRAKSADRDQAEKDAFLKRIGNEGRTIKRVRISRKEYDALPRTAGTALGLKRLSRRISAGFRYVCPEQIWWVRLTANTFMEVVEMRGFPAVVVPRIAVFE